MTSRIRASHSEQTAVPFLAKGGNDAVELGQAIPSVEEIDEAALQGLRSHAAPGHRNIQRLGMPLRPSSHSSTPTQTLSSESPRWTKRAGCNSVSVVLKRRGLQKKQAS